MSESPWDKVAGLARAGQDGVRATRVYYASAGPDERRLVRASFFTGITSGVLWSPLFYFWGALNFTSEEIGIMGGVGAFVGVLAYLVGGYMADRIGRRFVFLIGLIFTAIGLTMFLTGRDLILFTVAYSFASIGGSLAWPSLTALMAEKTAPEKMKYFYGVQGFYNQLGLTLATFVGIFGPAFVLSRYSVELTNGYAVVFLVTALCALAPIVYVLKVSEILKKRDRVAAHYDHRMRSILLIYCIQNGMIGLGAAFVIPWFPLIFGPEGMGATGEQIALIFTLSNSALAVGWFVVPRFAEFRGSVALITVCQLASCVPLLLIPYSSSLLVVVAVLYTLRSFLMIVPTPVLNAYLMNVVTEEIRASFLGLSQVAWQVPYALGTIVAGIVWASDYTRKEPFYIAIVLYVAASVMFWVYFRKVKEGHMHPGIQS